MGDVAFKKVASLVGVTSTVLRRRLPLHHKKLTRITAGSNILNGSNVAVVSASGTSAYQDLISGAVTRSGGVVHGADAASAPLPLTGIVCDTTGIQDLSQLKALHTKLHPLMRSLDRNGRLVMLSGDRAHAQLPSVVDPVSGAVGGAVKGFMKAMAKEVGARGTTANSLHLSMEANAPGGGAADALEGPLQWLLSPRSAYVTGQEIRVGRRVDAAPSDTAASFDVSGRRVVITGAARGIGEYTARLFAAEGARLLLVDHPAMADRLTKLAAELAVGGGEGSVAAETMDVTSADAPEALLRGIAGAFGADSQVDAVVHNAGITKDKTFKNMTEDNFAAVVNVNLAAVQRMDAALMLDGDVVAQGGRITYLSSISGIAGNFGQTNYSCSKGGIVGYVAALAPVMAQKGIGVNAVAPGFIETEMTSKIPYITRNVARFANDLKQEGYPVDIAEALLFLSSPASAGVSGITLRVCGGNIVGA